MLLVFVFLALMMVSILGAYGCMGVWVYRDAKNRGLEAGMWAVIAVVAPNLIGLLLYFILGRGKAQVACRSCGAKVPGTAQYCLQCGQPMTAENIEQANPHRSTRGPLIGISVFITLFVCSLAALALVSFTGGRGRNTPADTQSAVVNAAVMEDKWKASGFFIGLMNVSMGNEWRLSYYYSSKDVSRSITIPEEGKTMEVTGRCKEGEAELVVSQGQEELVIPFTAQEESWQIDLTGFQPGKVYLTVRQKEARSVSLRVKVV